MFVPEENDYFHAYTQGGGLNMGVFQCLSTTANGVRCKLVARTPDDKTPVDTRPYVFARDRVSFWPVQPGYRESLLGDKFAMARKLDEALVKADPEYCKEFAKYKVHPEKRAQA
jgi:hypothetical protein